MKQIERSFRRFCFPNQSLFLAVIFLFSINGIALAQPSFTEHIVSSTLGGASSVDQMDMDNDGDIDILASGWSSGHVKWYENTGDYDNFITHDIGTSSGIRSSIPVDIDDDGDFDVLGASWDHSDIVLWRQSVNNGVIVWTQEIIDNSMGWAADVNYGDFDGDGDIDVTAVGTNDDLLSWYEYNGTSWTEHQVAGGLDHIVDVEVADMDNDGDLDLVSCSNFDDELHVFLNDGNGSSWTDVLVSTGRGYFSTRLYDIDMDGDLDIVASANAEGEIVLFENDANTWTEAYVITDYARPTKSDAADINSDGIIDLIVPSQTNNMVTVFYGDGTPFDGGWDSHAITTEMPHAAKAIVTDLDDNGVLDIVAAAPSQNGWNQAYVKCWINLDEPQEPAIIVVPHLAGVVDEYMAVPVIMQSPSDVPVMAMQGDIVLPENFFTETTVELFIPENGVANPADWMIDYNISANVISFALASSVAMEMTQGPILMIRGLVAPDLALGTYDITLENVSLNEGSPQAIIENGSVTFLDYFWGDVSMNDEVMALDASLILSWLAETETLEDDQLLLANVSANMEVDEFDAALILQYVTGNIAEFPIQSGEVFPGDATIDDYLHEVEESAIIEVPLVLSNTNNMLSCAINLNLPDGVELINVENEIGLVATRTVETTSDLFFTFDEVVSGEDHTIATLELAVDWAAANEFDIEINLLEVNDYFTSNEPRLISITLDVENEINSLITSFQLLETYPNPFNPSLIIKSNLQQAGDLNIKIFDTLGREIQTITSGLHNSGIHSFIFDATGLASGTYYVQASNPQMGTSTNQVILLK